MNERQFRRTLIAIYAFRIFLGGMACCIPIIVLFWKHCGMSLTGIMILQSFFALMLLIFEVPSGYCADLWGRKKVLVLSSLFLIIGSGIYTFADRILHFVISEIAFALGISLISGTCSSLLYDALKERGEEERYSKIWGSMLAISLISCALFTSTGGMLYEYHIRLPFIISMLITIGTLPSALCMHEPERSKLSISKGYIRKLFSILHRALTQSAEYRNLLITYALVFTFVQTGLWFYKPYFQGCGITPFWFGFIFTAFNLVAALGAKCADIFDKRTAKLPLGVIPLIAVAASYLGMSICWLSWGFLIIFIQQIIRGWFFIAISHRIHRQIDSSERATLISLCSMAGSTAYAAYLPLAGVIADNISIAAALQMCGLLSLACAGIGLAKSRLKWFKNPSLLLNAD